MTVTWSYGDVGIRVPTTLLVDQGGVSFLLVSFFFSFFFFFNHLDNLLNRFKAMGKIHIF